MAPTKLLNLIAYSSLAILACSFGATPVNAVSVDTSHFVRHAGRGHAAVAKKKRGASGKRCKPRPTSSLGQVTSANPTPSPPVSTKVTPPPQPTTVSTKAPAPSPPPSNPPPSSGGGNGKVGIAWALGEDPALKNFKTNKVSPIYTWSPWIPQKAKSLGFDPIPMLWSEKQLADFKRLVVKGYASTVLGFNEPNQKGQADMTPQHAADVWRQNINPLKDQGYRLISPAVTSAPSGKQWMKDFFTACNGCHFDGLALHWYGNSPQEFIKYITDFHNTFGLPIWVTEFACQCTRDEVFTFMKTVKDFMNNTSWVAHYFAFGVMHDMVGVNPANQLMASNGFPTDLGYLYIN
ncbi:glycosyl hydrolase catalytic core-domain-containing protein [Collybia nuda]|uniref:Glycosyl hydrolase catalytic core-domain-containing protein n=1 Tax=Collybia nuda TaxID=64659 RepID=A0A9P5YJP0_9AGAR|nr:glycosyl hydrolase catalytic core-domain-containing protein [Collybia nuda]